MPHGCGGMGGLMAGAWLRAPARYAGSLGRRALHVLGLTRRRNLEVIDADRDRLGRELQRQWRLVGQIRDSARAELLEEIRANYLAMAAEDKQLPGYLDIGAGSSLPTGYASSAAMALAESDPGKLPPVTLPEEIRVITPREVMYARTIAALAEIDFRTALWHRAAQSPASAAPGDYGFAPIRLEPADPQTPGARFTKVYEDRLFISGLEARRACWLELSCLTRLQALGGGAARHFPTPLAVDADRPSLTMTYQGWSLDAVPGDKRADVATRLLPQLERQSDEIVAMLSAAGVINLDIHFTGKNMTVTEDGVVSLIDFDIATIDQHPISAEIRNRLRIWHARGGYRDTSEQIMYHLARFCDQALATTTCR